MCRSVLPHHIVTKQPASAVCRHKNGVDAFDKPGLRELRPTPLRTGYGCTDLAHPIAALEQQPCKPG